MRGYITVRKSNNQNIQGELRPQIGRVELLDV